jgi:hypothetical protein
MTVLDAMTDDHVFGKWFHGPSWDAWRAFLAALFALPMNDAQLALYRRHTGRHTPPIAPCRECWVCCGRRAGKSIVAALISVYLSAFVDHTQYLGPGEVSTSMVVSPDRRQSRIIGRFQRGFVRSVPMIEALVMGETKESLELSNRTILETQTADPSTLRGYVAHLIVNDEIAYLPTESSAEPDTEILIAERPCLASLPGSLLLSISSPYSRRGSLYDAYQAHYAKDGDPVLFWKASSLEMNPSLDPAIIAAAYELDPAVASAEWGGEFRSDCERLFTEAMLDRVEDLDRPEILPPCFEEETA